MTRRQLQAILVSMREAYPGVEITLQPKVGANIRTRQPCFYVDLAVPARERLLVDLNDDDARVREKLENNLDDLLAYVEARMVDESTPVDALEARA
jgi:hypothetical protein